MAEIINVKRPDDIGMANEIIHDCYFDVDDIVFDAQASVLSFKFRRPIPSKRLSLRDFVSSSRTKPTREYILSIRNVVSYSIQDTANVGTYDFNVLEFDPSTHRIYVRTNIPIDIKIAVRDLDIWIEQASGESQPIQT